MREVGLIGESAPTASRDAGSEERTLSRLVAPARRSPSELLDVARRFGGSAPSALEPGPLVERRYELLELTDDLEVWVIHWPVGGRLELHDHGGSNGALWVRSGRLREAYVTGGRQLARRSLRAGAGTAFGPAYVHDVINAGRRPATSVHAYSPPMASMTFFRRDASGLSVERTDYRSDPSWAP